MSNHKPGENVFVELTYDQAQFMIENCNANIEFGLKALQEFGSNRETATKLVDNIEQFKAINRAVAKAIP